jgi:hypothetical protein
MVIYEFEIEFAGGVTATGIFAGTDADAGMLLDETEITDFSVMIDGIALAPYCISDVPSILVVDIGNNEFAGDLFIGDAVNDFRCRGLGGGGGGMCDTQF